MPTHSTEPGVVEHEADTTNPPLVPKDGYFEGQVAVVGETRISGKVQGTLRGPGRLTIDPGAHLEGVVDCDRLVSSGQITGPVHARRHVRLSAGAHLEGDLDAPAVDMADDAVWNGRARIGR